MQSGWPVHSQFWICDGCVGLDFGAVHGDGSQHDQSHLACPAHHLGKEFSEDSQVHCANSAVGGEVEYLVEPQTAATVRRAHESLRGLCSVPDR